MLDELREPLELCFLSFCSDDPVGAYPLVPRSLRAEEFPGALVSAKLLFLGTSETSVFALFVRVDGGFLLVTGGESLEAGGMHHPLLGELFNEIDINGAPSTGGLAGCETDRVTGFVKALSNAVDPAEAKGGFH